MTLNPAYSWIGGSCERLLDVCPYLRLPLRPAPCIESDLTLDVRHCSLPLPLDIDPPPTSELGETASVYLMSP